MEKTNALNDILKEVVKRGDLARVKTAVAEGANIHTDDDYPIKVASVYGHLEVVKFLMEKGAHVHSENFIAVQWAAEAGHLEVVKYLCERITYQPLTSKVLGWASRMNQTEVMKYALENDADVHIDDNLALKWASQQGNLEAVKLLLEAGADMHAEQGYALRFAANCGHLEVAETLVEAGADVHAFNSCAVVWALEKGHQELFEFLVIKGNWQVPSDAGQTEFDKIYNHPKGRETAEKITEFLAERARQKQAEEERIRAEERQENAARVAIIRQTAKPFVVKRGI